MALPHIDLRAFVWFLAALCSPICIYSQDSVQVIEDEVLSSPRLDSILGSSEAELLVFSNCSIEYISKKRSSTYPTIEVKPHVVFDNVKVIGQPMAIGIQNNMTLYIYHLKFKNLAFSGGFMIRNSHQSKNLDLKFENCSFLSRAVFANNSYASITFDSCQFYSDFIHRSNSLKLKECYFYASPGRCPRFDVNSKISLSDFEPIEYDRPIDWIFTSSGDGIIISECHFRSSATSDQITLIGEPSNLAIDRSDIDVPLSLSRIENLKEIEIHKTKLHLLDISGVHLPEPEFVSIDYSDSINLGLQVPYYSAFKKGDQTIGWSAHQSFFGGRQTPTVRTIETELGHSDTLNDKTLAFEPLFKELFQSYYSLLNIYKLRGDLDAWNSCKYDLENVRKNYLANTHRRDRTFTTLVEWRLHSFLGFYSHYGNSPPRAIVVCTQTILLFSLIYFFFYSDWDDFSITKLMRRHSTLVDYLTNEQRMEDFYTKQNVERINQYNDYRDKMINSRSKIPWFTGFIGKPLFASATLNHNFIKWIYGRFEIVQGKWATLPKGKRRTAATLVSFYTVLYILYTLLLRGLNSFFLSLNAFSTLGFGAIPVRGFLRYIAILEGFIGWFFLSLFLASLLTQSSSF
jgi:hypothetical protein